VTEGEKTQEAHAIADSQATDEEAAGELEAVEADGGDPAIGEGHEPPERLKSIIESLLFASDKPLSMKRLTDLTKETDLGQVAAAVEQLRADYADRGVVLHEVAGGFQFRTNPINAHWVRELVSGKPVKLSRAQLETLAILAYRQPITRPEIDEIRGVDSGGTLKTLLDRNLVRVLGKKEEPGRPLLYGTTQTFLEFFNLKDLKDLPTLREFYELSEESMARLKELDEARDAAASETPSA
jgi:segregation and condensation protein B